MLSLCSDIIGSTCSINFCKLSLASDSDKLNNTKETLLSNAPDFSYAAMVFSKVGAAVSFTMASISASCSLIPASKAGK